MRAHKQIKYFVSCLILILLFCFTEKMINYKNISSPLPKTEPHPEGSPNTLCYLPLGRFGNHLFLYASLLGIARSKDMTPVFQLDRSLIDVFQLGIPLVSEQTCNSSRPHPCKRSCAFDTESVGFDNKHNTILLGMFQSWKYFIGVEEELRHHFTFHRPIIDEAWSILITSITEQKNTQPDGHVLVGIHVRRGDMLFENYVESGYRVPPREYFIHAMDYFRSVYDKVLFIVCSTDTDWSIRSIKTEDTVIIPTQKPPVDMAILSLCDHSIMSVGSFGWWAAWLAGGTTVYYKHQYQEGSDLAKQFNLDDYIYPGWIAME